MSAGAAAIAASAAVAAGATSETNGGLGRGVDSSADEKFLSSLPSIGGLINQNPLAGKWGPRGFPTLWSEKQFRAIQDRRFQDGPGANDRCELIDFHVAMVNSPTALQYADLISQALITASKDTNYERLYTDVGDLVSAPAAALLVHPICHPNIPGVLPDLMIGNMRFSNQANPVMFACWLLDTVHQGPTDQRVSIHSLIRAIADRLTRTVFDLTGSAQVKRPMYEACEKIMRVLQFLPIAKSTPAEDADAKVSKTRMELNDAVVDLVNVSISGNMEDEKGGQEQQQQQQSLPPWNDEFARAAIDSFVNEMSRLKFNEVSPELGFYMRYFQPPGTRERNPHYIRRFHLSGTPSLPMPGMFEEVHVAHPKEVLVFNFTLYHEQKKPLILAAMECLFLRLIATIHSSRKECRCVVFFNDFAGRLFPETETFGDGGTGKGGPDVAGSKRPMCRLRERMIDGSLVNRALLGRLAEQFHLGELASACRVKENKEKSNLRIECWDLIRKAIFTAKIERGSEFFSACMTWMKSVLEVNASFPDLYTQSMPLAPISLQELEKTLVDFSWRIDTATYVNGLQIVRLAPSSVFTEPADAMQRSLSLPSKDVYASQARQFQAPTAVSAATWVPIGAVPHNADVLDEGKKKPVDFNLRVRRRLASSQPEIEAALAPALEFTKNNFVARPGTSDVEWFTEIVDSQPSYRNAVLAECILEQMSGGPKVPDRTFITINDWLGTWSGATRADPAQGESVQNLIMPTLMHSSVDRRAEYANMFKNQQNKYPIVHDVSAIGKYPSRRPILPIMLNLNWGSPKTSPTGEKSWSQLDDSCRELGKFISRLAARKENVDSIVLCVLLPGRKITSAVTTKHVIGDQDHPEMAMYDTPLGEFRPLAHSSKSFELFQSILTRATLLIMASNELRGINTDVKMNSIDEYVSIHEVPLAPGVSAVFFKIWPGMDKPSRRPLLSAERKQFKTYLSDAYDEAETRLMKWLPPHQRKEYEAIRKARHARMERMMSVKPQQQQQQRRRGRQQHQQRQDDVAVNAVSASAAAAGAGVAAGQGAEHPGGS